MVILCTLRNRDRNCECKYRQSIAQNVTSYYFSLNLCGAIPQFLPVLILVKDDILYVLHPCIPRVVAPSLVCMMVMLIYSTRMFLRSPQWYLHPKIWTICLLWDRNIWVYLLNCKYVLQFKMAWSLSVHYAVSKLWLLYVSNLFLYVFFTINIRCEFCDVLVCMFELLSCMFVSFMVGSVAVDFPLCLYELWLYMDR